MSSDQENVSKILSVLSHKIRREILMILHQKGEASFTDLMKALEVDTGKLSFHIRSLSIFLEQTESGKYKLNMAGKDAVRVIMDVESWAELASLDKKTSQLPLASFKRRAAAFLVDFGIMLIFSVPVLLPGQLTAPVGLIIKVTLATLYMLFATAAILWIYSTILEGFSGQTVGKRALGLTVVRVDGKKIDYEHAAVRNFGKVLLPFDLAFGYTLNDPRFIRYFDKFAGTTVLELRKRAPSETVAEPQEPESAQKTAEPTT
ncbi:MAG TPA: RDD family protein [Candidatus Nanoarchaeia archaeon]|nr:RDD family protein [Candidatus Nanoarchaeia archaeon]